MAFSLGALGAGLGQFAQDYRQQQEAELRQQQMKLQMAQFQQKQLEQQQMRQAQASLWPQLLSGEIGGAQPIQGQTVAPTQSGGDLGGGMRAGGALTGNPRGGAGWGPLAYDAIDEMKKAGASDAFIQGALANGLAEGGFQQPWQKAGGGENSFGHWQLNARGELPGYQRTFGGDTGTRSQAKYLMQRAEEVAPGVTKIDDPRRATDLIETKFERPRGAAPGQRYGQLAEVQRRMGGAPQATPVSYSPPSPGAAATETPGAPVGQVAQNAPGASPSAGQQDFGGGADIMAPVRREVQQGIQGVAKITPPSVYGKMGIQGLARQIDKAAPDASPAVKFMMLQEAQTLLAPDAKMQWEAYKEQHNENFQKEMAVFRDNLSEGSEKRREALAEQKQDARNRQGGEVLTDPESGKQFVYNKFTKQATTLTGEPYTPSGAQKLGGGGSGSPLSADRAKDLAGETSRLDKEWAESNPLASAAEKQQAHFKNRATAEKVLAEAKTSTGRQSPRTVIFRKAMEEHPDATAEELQTYYNNQVLNEKITASFGGGDAAKQMRAVNTVADHILRVEDYAKALQNGDIPRANQIANIASRELGRPEVTNFEAGRDIMADEVVRLLTSTGGTEADRKGMQERISQMMSPDQFAGVFGAFKDFSGARFDALRQQFSHNDPKREAEFGQFLTPAARRVFEGMKPAGGAAPPGTAAPGAGTPPPGTAAQGRRSYRPGEVIEKGGKRYRVTGGDPFDPDVEVVQ